VDIRRDESKCFGSANLIFHHGLVNVIHQIAEPLRVVGVVQELRDILLSCHWVQGFVDIFQFPTDHLSLVSAFHLEKVGLLCQLLSPRSLLEITLRSRCTERFNKDFYPGPQRLYRLFVDFCLLGEL